MEKKTIFNLISTDWRRAKNHCRRTVGKQFTENVPSDEFKEKLAISEHSPIRVIEVDWTWENIPYWVSTEWSRHKFEKFITSQRNDRQQNYDRNAARQDAPVNFDGFANLQNLIDAWRKRLCFKATKEARELAEDFKIALESEDKAMSKVLVPNCIYRFGCPEFTPCGFFKNFLEFAEQNNISIEQLSDINIRYELFSKMLKTRHRETNV